MTLKRSALVASLLAAMLLGAAHVASADDAAARVHFRQGVDLYDKKQYEPALESFKKAYAEKPSPGIKQNIALCLKGLGRPVEAATAFDDALDEGRDTLKPEVRGAMEQELAELSKIIATVRLRVISSTDQQPIEDVVVSVDGKALGAAALHRPIRLDPGIHVFTAHAEHRADPPDKKLSILAGSPVDATFEITPTAVGKLTIKPSVGDAIVQIDGKPIARNAWPLSLAAGKHRLTVSAPGYQTTSTEVAVSSDAEAEYPITLLLPGDLPSPYEGGAILKKPPPPFKTRYFVPMLAYEGQSFRLSPALGERPGGSKRNFTGASAGVRGGYRFSRYFALEVFGDVGQVSTEYTIGTASESTTKVLAWQLMPMARLTTGGAIRFVAGMGVGIQGLSVTADVATADATSSKSVTYKGSGLSSAWLADMGMQFDVGSLFLEGVGFIDVHGVGTTRDDSTNQRLFLSSPSTRTGVRIGLGIPF